jgi:pimeloyl-ACP methyl ester carboxylesterase
MSFPFGYRRFHPDPSLNFELNRWLSALPEEELLELAPRISTLDDWHREMLEHARRAEDEGRLWPAAFYYRAAEFFLDAGAPEKEQAYQRFQSLFERAVRDTPHAREPVPFDGVWLPALVLAAAGEEKGTILLHGGFDSFMEELFEWGTALARGGYRVILFEGPGQGAVLRRHGRTMGPEWERPVAAVLDHFAVESATILGISLGGYLAPRAAAFEPRIRRVIVCDVLDDFFDCFAERTGERVARMLSRLHAFGWRRMLNALVARATSRDAATGWALRHGMHVSGARDAFDFVGWLESLRTKPFAHRLTQDVLLLAGAEDHIVPLRQLYRQAQNLPNVRSLTTRLFTAQEQAQNHCQIGNVGLVIRVILSWLDCQVGAAEAPHFLPAAAGAGGDLSSTP